MNRNIRNILVASAGVVVLASAATAWLVRDADNRDGRMPPDKRVPWLQPPGEFEPVGGRVKSAIPTDVPGGFVDYADRTVHFRGIAVADQPDWQAKDNLPPFEDWKKQGINMIKVPVRWRDLEPVPMEVSVDTIMAVRRYVDGAAAAGIGVILENTTSLSATPARSEGSAQVTVPDAPEWAFRADGSLAADRFRLDFLDATWTPDNLTLQDHLIRCWIKLAEVVANSGAITGYGITSSMDCPSGLTERTCRADWTDFTRRFVHGVRAVHGPALFVLNTGNLAVPAASDTIFVSELVPRNAEDFRFDIITAVPSGTFGIKTYFADSESSLVKIIDAVERRGRSFVVGMTAQKSASALAASRRLPFGIATSRPYPEAVTGKRAFWSFDRTSIPASAEEDATAAGSTDVFTLQFEDVPTTDNNSPETSIWIPTSTLYAPRGTSDAPMYTIEVSDGTAGMMPGRDDAILWRTEPGTGPHQIRIAPWGGRRLVPPSGSAGHGDPGEDSPKDRSDK